MGKDKSGYNIGISILKSLMCFEVVMCHCFELPDNAPGFIRFVTSFRSIAVPTFMFLSFFFFYKTLANKNDFSIRKRIIRLYIPLAGWAVIYFAFAWVYRLFVDTEELKFSSLIWQLITGHSSQLNPSMWFQSVLIVLTVLFFLCTKYCKKYSTYIFIFLLLFSLVWQYSNIYSCVNELQYELKYPIGRFFEMIPCALAGYYVASVNLLDRLKEKWKETLVFFIPAIFLNWRFVFFAPAGGYGYEGIRGTIVAFMLVAVFYVIPFEKVSEKTYKCVMKITRYTLGIYCMHRLVFLYLNIAFIHWNIGVAITSLWLSAMVYIICWLVSHVCTCFFKNNVIRDMFE